MELILAVWCEKYHCLPSQLLQEDYFLFQRMEKSHNAFMIVSKLRSLRGEQIHTLTDGERRALRALKDDGLL